MSIKWGWPFIWSLQPSFRCRRHLGYRCLVSGASREKGFAVCSTALFFPCPSLEDKLLGISMLQLVLDRLLRPYFSSLGGVLSKKQPKAALAAHQSFCSGASQLAAGGMWGTSLSRLPLCRALRLLKLRFPFPSSHACQLTSSVALFLFLHVGDQEWWISGCSYASPFLHSYFVIGNDRHPAVAPVASPITGSLPSISIPDGDFSVTFPAPPLPAPWSSLEKTEQFFWSLLAG